MEDNFYAHDILFISIFSFSIFRRNIIEKRGCYYESLHLSFFFIQIQFSPRKFSNTAHSTNIYAWS